VPLKIPVKLAQFAAVIVLIYIMIALSNKLRAANVVILFS